MVNLISRIAVTAVLIGSVLYQFIFKELLVETLGHGRTLQSIKSFSNYKCERLQVEGLESCEDMYLHEASGHLYMACSTIQSRLNWTPAMDKLNAAGRSKTDRLGVLDIRGTGSLASHFRWLSVEGFEGNNGDGTFDTHGIGFLPSRKTNTLRILLINHRPPLDPATGKFLDATRVGANSTIEHFLTEAGSSSIRHVRTQGHPLIETPNAVQWVSDHSFVTTNDHSSKVGFRRSLDIFLGGGNVVYCDRSRCNVAVSDLSFPNGATRSPDGLIYVVQLLKRIIDVYSLTEDHVFKLEDTIDVGLPIDNLSIDSEGTIWAAAFPQAYKMQKGITHVYSGIPTAVFKISREGKKADGKRKWSDGQIYQGEYIVEKVLEDDGTLLSGSTTAVHDPNSGKIFLSGILSPFVAVCEPKGR